MASKIPSVKEIRELHQAEADRISQSIRNGSIDNLRVSDGVFAKGFSGISEDQRKERAKARLRALNGESRKMSMEP